MNELHDWQEGQLASLKNDLDRWILRPERTRYNSLRKGHISNINNLARKGITGENLNGGETKAKSESKLWMKYAFIDIVQILEIASPSSLMGMTVDIYSNDEWREILPINNVVLIVKMLTARFGEEYALRIADELRQGMKEYELRHGRDTNIDVPIIKRITSDSWDIVDYGKIKKRRPVGRPPKSS